MLRTITGFHAIDEKIRSFKEASLKKKNGSDEKLCLFYDKAGPRIKKILEKAQECEIPVEKVSEIKLQTLVANLTKTAQEHRGIVLTVEGEIEKRQNFVDFDAYLCELSVSNTNERRSIIVILDSITDPHNVGAILRSCDQFGVDLVVVPERRSSIESEVVDRSSAGASAWVPVSVVPNLVRSADLLKNAGYWIYGADAGGMGLTTIDLPSKVVVIMGSEGGGLARLLKESCDTIVSIPTCGKLDSLNVSVAAGILLYEMRNR